MGPVVVVLMDSEHVLIAVAHRLAVSRHGTFPITMELMPPALAGGFLIRASSGKLYIVLFLIV